MSLIRYVYELFSWQAPNSISKSSGEKYKLSTWYSFLKNNLLWICIFNSGVIASEFRKKNHPPPKKKNRTKISVYLSYYVGVKLSSVSSVPDEYVLRLLGNGEKG